MSDFGLSQGVVVFDDLSFFQPCFCSLSPDFIKLQTSIIETDFFKKIHRILPLPLVSRIFFGPTNPQHLVEFQNMKITIYNWKMSRIAWPNTCPLPSEPNNFLVLPY